MRGKISVGDWIIKFLFMSEVFVFLLILGSVNFWEKVGVLRLEGMESFFVFFVFKYL